MSLVVMHNVVSVDGYIAVHPLPGEHASREAAALTSSPEAIQAPGWPGTARATIPTRTGRPEEPAAQEHLARPPG